jgi:methylphosphotriester-DNA--protein-cysteine methyltransferase
MTEDRESQWPVPMTIDALLEQQHQLEAILRTVVGPSFARIARTQQAGTAEEVIAEQEAAVTALRAFAGTEDLLAIAQRAILISQMYERLGQASLLATIEEGVADLRAILKKGLAHPESTE